MKIYFVLSIMFFSIQIAFSGARGELEIKSTQHDLGGLPQGEGLPAGTEILVKRTSESPLLSQLSFSYNWQKKVCVLKVQKTEWWPEKCSVIWRHGYYQRVCTPGYWKTVELCGKEVDKVNRTLKTLRLDFTALTVLKKGEEEFFMLDIVQEKINSDDTVYAASIIESKTANSIDIKEDQIIFY